MTLEQEIEYQNRMADMIEKKFIPITVINDIKNEIKEWYWQADKQALAKDPCVVDAMIDLFIHTIDKHIEERD